MISRKVKQELLLSDPELKGIYSPLPIKKIKKRKRQDNDFELIEVGRTTKRRPYNYKGRKGKLKIRPGVPVIFTPGQKTTQTYKRSYDEVMGDADILEAYEANEGEFAYGKKPKMSSLENVKQMIIDNYDTKPLIPPEAIKGIKRRADEALETLNRKHLKMEEPEIVWSSAKRRPYNYKGRRGQLKLRPGVPIIFTPGEKSSKTYKRSFDEVMTDSNILSSQFNLEDEFAYGKRILLDNVNPTPSVVPITKQQVLNLPKALKRKAVGDPTLEILASKQTKMEESESQQPIEIKMRPIKKVGRRIGVQTVDVSIPLTKSVVSPMEVSLPPESPKKPPVLTSEAMVISPVKKSYGPANSIMPKYRLHPSIKVGPSPLVSSKRRRRRKNKPTSNIIPNVRYHPSIKMPKRTIIPAVRYHPSINAPEAKMRFVTLL
ncbi:pV [California sea lion adenovirus 1]|uniref:PV n=1 Tax=California sea lion adenovirus 1 TaxID=943083 RepID=A0A059XJ43_9ADEN|nr:pV [California sea lion adenovirus 1]AIA22354.1 pV [California sea lion adenovirus 1]